MVDRDRDDLESCGSSDGGVAVLTPRTEVNPWEQEWSREATPDDVAFCFRLLLGRDPTPEEWPGHRSFADRDLTDVVRAYVTSAEFVRRDLMATPSRFEEVETPAGFTMFADPHDLAVGQHIAAGVMYEPAVTEAFQRHVRPGAGVLDVGANIGWFSMLGASLAGPRGRVTAVEPNPSNARAVEAARLRNGFENVNVVQAAAGQTMGLLVLYTSGSNGVALALSDDPREVLDATSVAVVRLDDVIDHRVDVLKVDVEGAEYSVLMGARALIGRSRPTIITEFTPSAMPGVSGVTGEDYLSLLVELGYGMTVLSEDEAPITCGSDVSAVMDVWKRAGSDHLDLLCLPRAR
jgi:FkbM family methyltransferase